MRAALDDPDHNLRVNGADVRQLLEAAARARVPKVVMASTGSVLGEADGVQDEATPPRPINVVGPRQDDSNAYGGVVPIFVRSCLEETADHDPWDGEQVRSFTSVHDIVRANLSASTNPDMSGELFHYASGIQISVLELASFIREELQANVPVEFAPGVRVTSFASRPMARRHARPASCSPLIGARWCAR